jgi:hypothetical protein
MTEKNRSEKKKLAWREREREKENEGGSWAETLSTESARENNQG